MNIKTYTHSEGLNYYVFFPKNYDPNKVYPTLVFLHGAGERGNTVDSMDIIKKHWPLAHTNYETFPFLQ